MEGDISLKNVYISDLGIKVYIKKVKFGELRDENLQFHLQVEAKMLNNFARILIEMLSNDNQNILGTIDDVLANLQISPELKAIIYECLHAVDKVQEMEQEQYDNEVTGFILQEKFKRQKEEAEANKPKILEGKDDYKELMEFKKTVEKQGQAEEQAMRAISRKSSKPQANKKNFEQENKDQNEVDRVL